MKYILSWRIMFSGTWFAEIIIITVHCAKLAAIWFMIFDLEITNSFNFDANSLKLQSELIYTDEVYRLRVKCVCFYWIESYRPLNSRTCAVATPWSRHGKSVKKTTTDKRLTFNAESKQIQIKCIRRCALPLAPQPSIWWEGERNQQQQQQEQKQQRSKNGYHKQMVDDSKYLLSWQ